MSLDNKPAIHRFGEHPVMRAAVLGLGGLQVLFWLYLFVYIGQHSNPKGDGMEWVAMAPTTFILGAFAAPALLFGKENRRLPLALLFAIAGAAINIAFFAEIASEFAESGMR